MEGRAYRDAIENEGEIAEDQPAQQEQAVDQAIKARTGTTGAELPQAVERQAGAGAEAAGPPTTSEQPSKAGEGSGRPGEEVTHDAGAEGKPQLVIPGAEKIGQGEQAQRGADKPMRPTKAQKPPDEGLFGDEPKQTDLVDMARKAKPPPSNQVEKINTSDQKAAEKSKAPAAGPSDSGGQSARVELASVAAPLTSKAKTKRGDIERVLTEVVRHVAGRSIFCNSSPLRAAYPLMPVASLSHLGWSGRAVAC